MDKLKKVVLILAMLMVSSFCIMTLVSCGGVDSDGDGFTDDFEEENGLDPNEYTWNEDTPF